MHSPPFPQRGPKGPFGPLALRASGQNKHGSEVTRLGEAGSKVGGMCEAQSGYTQNRVFARGFSLKVDITDVKIEVSLEDSH